MKLSFSHLVAALSIVDQGLGETDYTLPLSKENVHWGYYSKTLQPVLTVPSGATVTIETVTLNACEDYDKMIKGDKPVEDIYFWDTAGQNVPFRGPTGTGDGGHIMTGPVFVEGAEPGDLLKVEILDVKPRYNPEGRAFGSVVIGNWGFQAWVNKSDGEPWVAGAPHFDEVRLICDHRRLYFVMNSPHHVVFVQTIYVEEHDLRDLRRRRWSGLCTCILPVSLACHYGSSRH